MQRENTREVINVERGIQGNERENSRVGMIKILRIHVLDCQRIYARYSKT